MPELPEVTTIVQGLQKHVRGKVITDVWIDSPKIIAPLSLMRFRRSVSGRAFVRFTRRGKFIIATLGHASHRLKSVPSLALVWHMRMTGHLLFRDERHETPQDTRAFADPRNQHVRLRLLFGDGTRLEYSDVRKFGTLSLLPVQDLPRYGPLQTLGPDALDTDLTPKALCERLRSRRRALKSVLLDQTVIAGIGNMYADEVLWDAHLSPLFPAYLLTHRDCERLLRSIRAILREAIRRHGTSMNDFRDVLGRKGQYGQIRNVYHRAGAPCFRCGTTLGKLVVGGRGTHICPACQRDPTIRQRR